MTGESDARLSSRRHGGNKDEQADALQRWMTASLGFAGDAAPCGYPGHRHSDWRLREGGGERAECGICHPPAPGLDFVIVGGTAEVFDAV